MQETVTQLIKLQKIDSRLLEIEEIKGDLPNRVEKKKNLSVDIPMGIETGTRIRLSGEGEAGIRGASSGDLFIMVDVEQHPIFKRRNENIR